MNPDGSGVVQLTDNDADDGGPDWSPDGTRILFTRVATSGANSDIYVMNADGSGQTRLTDNPAFDFWPVWSPDGTRIAFTSFRDAPWPGDTGDIFVMSRRQRPDEPHEQRRRRLLACLVSRRHEDRLHGPPRPRK